MPSLVRDVMTKDIFAVAPDTSLETAARMLASKEITGAPVVDDDGETVGVISLVDLVDPDNQASDDAGSSTFYRITDGWAMTKGEPKALGSGRVSDVMTPATLTTTEETTVLEATKLMLEYRVHRLLVENDGRLTGIVSTMDLLRGFVADQ